MARAKPLGLEFVTTTLATGARPGAVVDFIQRYALGASPRCDRAKDGIAGCRSRPPRWRCRRRSPRCSPRPSRSSPCTST
jgi:hypothetical protein